MSDGAEVEHFPGGPLTRRVWAGGNVEFADGWEESFRLDGRVASCVETVSLPVVRSAPQGAPGMDRIIVDVTRQYFTDDVHAGLDEIVRKTDEAPKPVITETRTLAFLSDEARLGEARPPQRGVFNPFSLYLTASDHHRYLTGHMVSSPQEALDATQDKDANRRLRQISQSTSLERVLIVHSHPHSSNPSHHHS